MQCHARWLARSFRTSWCIILSRRISLFSQMEIHCLENIEYRRIPWNIAIENHRHLYKRVSGSKPAAPQAALRSPEQTVGLCSPTSAACALRPLAFRKDRSASVRGPAADESLGTFARHQSTHYGIGKAGANERYATTGLARGEKLRRNETGLVPALTGPLGEMNLG